MKQDDLINQIATRTNTSKSVVKTVLDGLAVVVLEAVKNADEVTVPNICKIGSKLRAGRPGKNPRTGEPIQIAAKNVPTLTALKPLKDAADVEV